MPPRPVAAARPAPPRAPRSRAALGPRSRAAVGTDSAAAEKKRGARPVAAVAAALPVMVAVELAMNEAAARAAVAEAQGASWGELWCGVVRQMLRRERDAVLVSIERAALLGREVVEGAAAAAFALLVSARAADAARITSRATAESAGRNLISVVDAERSERRRLVYLEDRTFRDVAQVEAHMRAAATHRPHRHACAEVTADDTPRPSTSPGVRLTDGCPFINPRDCPFHGADWVDAASFRHQHQHRKCPRLRFPFRLEQLEYERILQARVEKARNVNLSMYEARVLSGVPTGQVF